MEQMKINTHCTSTYTSEYTTRRQLLETGIPMGCSVSPLLFGLAMEMVLRGAGRFAQRVEVANGQVMPPMKTFTDGINILTWDRECTTQLLTRLKDLIQWCRKPTQCRFLYLLKSAHKVVHFQIATIGTTCEESRQAVIFSYNRQAQRSIDPTASGRGAQINKPEWPLMLS